MKMKLHGFCTAAALTAFALPGHAQTAAEVIAALPDGLKSQYEGAPQGITPGPLADFTPKAKPYKWCHSESYQGNPWRVSVTAELKRLVDGLIAEGVVSDFEVSDSNGDVGQQINQIRAFIDKGCGVITSIPGSTTGLDEAVEAAAAAGIPFITAAGSVTSRG